MQSLFDEKVNTDMIDRIKSLNDSSTAQWGKMNIAQMLCHCQEALKVSLGELKLKRSLMGILFGAIAKKQLINEKPFKKNLPTDPHFIVKSYGELEAEKAKLIQLVRLFKERGQEGIPSEPHPFFGKMTVAEWDLLNCKHLDHHLRQFGA